MITQFNRDNYAKNLPDAYRKDDDSNNAKILAIEKHGADRLRNVLREIDDSLDIDNATGKTLDMYGEMLGQDRGMATDEQYRVLLKFNTVRNYVNGDYNSVVNLLSMIFGCEPTEIVLVEDEEDCSVRIENLPFSKINNLAIDTATVSKIIKEVIPAGVYLESVSFVGTFEFSGADLEYDTEKGFADEAQTIGGYLGHAFGGDSPDLPIS